ncbi:hypothetical protein FPV67DRAFT_1678529 [Lyophyllum atratum]|nr:hypothetical protein FPV67DRAFT_1678529 [Lyophyllum atratum]
MPKPPTKRQARSALPATAAKGKQTAGARRKLQDTVDTHVLPEARSSRSAARQPALPAGRAKRPASQSDNEQPATKKAKAAPTPRVTRRSAAAGSASSSSSARKPPPDINFDDEGPGEPRSAPARHVMSEDEDADEDPYEREPSDEEEDYDDELENLDPKSLKKALVAERARWAAPQSDGDDEDDFKVPDEDIELSTCSDIEEGAAGDVDDEGTRPRRSGGGSSKRARDRRAEVPMWNTDEVEESAADEAVADEDAAAEAIANEAKPEASDAESSSPTTLTPFILPVNAAWPSSAHYVPLLPGSRNLSLTVQPPNVRAVIKAAIRQVTGDALFNDAYPPAPSIDGYLHQMLIRLANELSLFALRDRLTIDRVLVSHISRLLSTRLSNVRCGAKKITLPKVETSFPLGGTAPERMENVRKLLLSGDYIYPRAENGLIRRTKPFLHPIILSSLREYYFSATRGSMAAKHASRFTSSIDTGVESTEREVPLPMVCMIATAAYAAIEDWNSGFLKKSEFNADEYEDNYRGHELFLNNIRASNPAAYHRLMADIYNEVSNSQASQSASVVANNAMALLDLAAMDV